MYTITVTEKSISVSGNGERFAVILTPVKKLETHNSIEGRGAKPAHVISANIKRMLTRQLSKRISWADRFKKVGKMLEKANTKKTTSLQIMSNNFDALLTESYETATTPATV